MFSVLERTTCTQRLILDNIDHFYAKTTPTTKLLDDLFSKVSYEHYYFFKAIGFKPLYLPLYNRLSSHLNKRFRSCACKRSKPFTITTRENNNLQPRLPPSYEYYSLENDKDSPSRQKHALLCTLEEPKIRDRRCDLPCTPYILSQPGNVGQQQEPPHRVHAYDQSQQHLQSG